MSKDFTNSSSFYETGAFSSNGGPLQGIKILEATIAAAGPICATILCDLGAESIKCEPPGSGDLMRQFPPFIGNTAGINNAAWYNTINRNKKAITLNLRTSEGQEIFRELAKGVDIVVENFTPGTMADWGLGYSDLIQINQRLVYVSVSAFGQWGPLREKKGFDPVAQAMTGLMSVTGEKGGIPLRTGTVIADNMAGWQGAIGALAALRFRDATGLGQHVDVSMADVMLNASDFGIMGRVDCDFAWSRNGNAIAVGAPMNVYKCADNRYVYIIAHIDAHWQRLLSVMDCAELYDEVKYGDQLSRAKNAQRIDLLISEWVSRFKSADLINLLDKTGVTSAPVLDFQEVAQFAQYNTHEAVVNIDHPLHGTLTTYGVATKYSKSKPHFLKAAPNHGEHNDEVFKNILGFDDAKIEELRSNQVI